MMFFVIEMDEERIQKDGKLYLDAVYRTIDNNFAKMDISLYKKEGNARYYTRDIDKHDFEYLWYMNGLFKKESWFQYYIKTWRFLDIDDEDGVVIEDEDLFEHWVKRPDNP